jgi:hypothetical protein
VREASETSLTAHDAVAAAPADVEAAPESAFIDVIAHGAVDAVGVPDGHSAVADPATGGDEATAVALPQR